MSKNILGIKPGIGGYKKIEIRPFLSNKINWAKGRIPLFNGNCIEVSWSDEPGSNYIFNLDIPQGRIAFLYIPVELRKTDFTINNKPYPKRFKKVKLDWGSYEIIFKRSVLN